MLISDGDLESLIKSTKVLRRFTYRTRTFNSNPVDHWGRIVAVLETSARDTLEYLEIDDEEYMSDQPGICWIYEDQDVQYTGLLRHFSVLKKVRVDHPMFIHCEGVGDSAQAKPQQLVTMLPASVEELELTCHLIPERTAEKLFAGLGALKEQYVSRLRNITFARGHWHHDAIWSACEEVGIAVEIETQSRSCLQFF
ncbi:hypothetical protein OEA41_008363 [Lepraria neglecta]|uniref:Uncharacterized protein n=1 Tax=Lepraria neglecta TaxID=209136 RepID=A0AAD9ZEK0_9LECA|nr:hypothetical protein OEA41_008363 [Lepraria neglecta]